MKFDLCVDPRGEIVAVCDPALRRTFGDAKPAASNDAYRVAAPATSTKVDLDAEVRRVVSDASAIVCMTHSDDVVSVRVFVVEPMAPECARHVEWTSRGHLRVPSGRLVACRFIEPPPEDVEACDATPVDPRMSVEQTVPAGSYEVSAHVLRWDAEIAANAASAARSSTLLGYLAFRVLRVPVLVAFCLLFPGVLAAFAIAAIFGAAGELWHFARAHLAWVASMYASFFGLVSMWWLTPIGKAEVAWVDARERAWEEFPRVAIELRPLGEPESLDGCTACELEI